jgi:RNA polymerase sigma-70 factor, ECF subfamily
MIEGREMRSVSEAQDSDALPHVEAQLLAELRAGDADAGRRFVREYYPRIYRHLLYLAGQREIAEDLTQETFFQAWRHLDGFEGRAPLGHWLHRIARREFLRALRSRRSQVSLEEAGNLAAPGAGAWTEAVELRELIRKLSRDQREVVVLHYLEGYDCEEIAAIVAAPVGTVKYRLSAARARLQQAMGEGDLAYLNERPLPGTRSAGGPQWAWLPWEQIAVLEARWAMGDVQAFRRSGVWAFGGSGEGEFESERLNARGPVSEEETMERREFLRSAAAGAAGLMLPEKEVVDGRLTQKVSLALKGTALSDVCEELRGKTNVHLAAGNSVADEKVTVFCREVPLREVMRQLSRPFGYAWVRSGTPGKYRYELGQDLKSQLLEEELRNRDSSEALLDLDRELQQYRPYLHLSPDEALARLKTASGAEKKLLEQLSGFGWAGIQLYSHLSPQQINALRAGQGLVFSAAPEPGELPLPPEIARWALLPFRDWYLVKREEGYKFAPDKTAPEAMAVPAIRDAQPRVTVTIEQSELGRMSLASSCRWFTRIEGKPDNDAGVQDNYVFGMSPVVFTPANARINAHLAHDPALRPRVTVCPTPGGALPRPNGENRPASSDASAESASDERKKVTMADVMEELHRATGMPIMADFYTRLYPAEAVSIQDQPLFDALNQLSDAMRLRWNREPGARDGGPTRTGGTWLQFRSTSFYNDRLKEVPNRLLSRWAAARSRQGHLTIDDLVEISQLPDAMLKATDMAEGAKACWGLTEWDLGSSGNLRPHLRFLAGFTPAQRQEAMTTAGLPFAKMSLAQQQQFLSLALNPKAPPLHSLEELAGATLRIEYTQPRWYQWGETGWGGPSRWVVPLEPGPKGRRVLRPSIRERTREAVLQAVRQVDPQIREALLVWRRRNDPRLEPVARVVEEEQIFPTKLDLTFAYVTGLTNARNLFIQGFDASGYPTTQ